MSAIAGLDEAGRGALFGPDGLDLRIACCGAPDGAGGGRVPFGERDGSVEARPLSSDEVGAVRNSIINGMRGLGYELRV